MEFERHFHDIVSKMPLARDWILSTQSTQWANVFFQDCRWGVMDNNLAESFNRWILATRFVPITSLVDHIRSQIMDMHHQKHEQRAKWHNYLYPRQQRRLQKNHREGRTLSLHVASRTKYEVLDGEERHAIDLSNRICTCKQLQLKMIPCKHACTSIEEKDDTLHSYCDEFFIVKMHQLAYREIINLVPTIEMPSAVFPGQVINIVPPMTAPRTGGPRTRRYTELERSLSEIEHARAIFELTVTQPILDMPELLCKACIDYEYEISGGEYERTRQVYERLLDRIKHLKV
uniref:Uncharacterized protein LOC105049230 n=1 Tax=Elaeis guineensis var. tenera TaxID=51953 RepID=A0A6I9RI19_ELAGV|nr:uncharacterized protein LOC105049230 [Elaeis guineensis]